VNNFHRQSIRRKTGGLCGRKSWECRRLSLRSDPSSVNDSEMCCSSTTARVGGYIEIPRRVALMYRSCDM